jgi:hypothetical protein
MQFVGRLMIDQIAVFAQGLIPGMNKIDELCSRASAKTSLKIALELKGVLKVKC